MATYKSAAATMREGAFSSMLPGCTTITASYSKPFTICVEQTVTCSSQELCASRRSNSFAVNVSRRTARNGNVDYLPNPYIEENLAFSFQLQIKAQEYYPGFTRHIYLQSLRYNLHLKPRALLIEAGSQLNTVEEEKNAMEPLADILDRVLAGR